MKKILFLLFMLVLVTGCKKEDPKPVVDEPIWEFAPHNVAFILLNPYGDNFFDPDFEGNILDRPIKIEYKGKTYELNEYYEDQTRAIPTRWYGLRTGTYIGYDGDDGTPALLFGEFSPQGGDGIDHGYHGETFTVDWGDGKTTSEVKFDLYVTFNHDGTEADVHKKLWIDDKLVNEDGLAATAVVRADLFSRSERLIVEWKPSPQK